MKNHAEIVIEDACRWKLAIRDIQNNLHQYSRMLLFLAGGSTALNFDMLAFETGLNERGEAYKKSMPKPLPPHPNHQHQFTVYKPLGPVPVDYGHGEVV